MAPRRRFAAALRRLRPNQLSRALARGLGAACLALCACGHDRDLSTEQLSRVVEAKRPALKVCYDAALAKFPFKQEMRMEAILHIAPSGRVAKVELQGGSGLPGMQDCLRAEIKRWQFPTAQAETASSLPLVFHPEVVKTQPSLNTLEHLLQQQAGK